MQSTSSENSPPSPRSDEIGQLGGPGSGPSLASSSVVGQISVVSRNQVGLWLEELNLPQLIPIFKENGIDEMELVKTLKEEELVAMGITQLGAKRKILMYAAKYGSNTQATPKRQKRVNNGTQEKPDGRGMRCAHCCMYKLTGPNLESHSCRTDLYDEETGARHTWEVCPTQNIKKHPEALKKQQEDKTKERKRNKEEKKKKKEQERETLAAKCRKKGNQNWNEFYARAESAANRHQPGYLADAKNKMLFTMMVAKRFSALKFEEKMRKDNAAARDNVDAAASPNSSGSSSSASSPLFSISTSELLQQILSGMTLEHPSDPAPTAAAVPPPTAAAVLPPTAASTSTIEDLDLDNVAWATLEESNDSDDYDFVMANLRERDEIQLVTTYWPLLGPGGRKSVRHAVRLQEPLTINFFEAILRNQEEVQKQNEQEQEKEKGKEKQKEN